MVKQVGELPFGFSEIPSLEEWDVELELDLAERWDSTVGEKDIRPQVKEVSHIEHMRLTAEGQYEFYMTTVTVQREVDVVPQFPTQLASGYDWLTRIDDNGLKQALDTIHRTLGGDVWIISDTGMGIDHVPAAAPSDRYVGQQWRCAPITEWHTPVCQVCNMQQSKTGRCECNDVFPVSVASVVEEKVCRHQRTSIACNWC